MQHMVKLIAFAAAAILLVPPGRTAAQTSLPEITAAELREHVKYLASDALEGRGSGAKGNAEAARYIASDLKLWGLKPAGDNGTYLQQFEFVSAVRAGEHNTCSLESTKIPEGKRALAVESDFRPLGFSSSGAASGALVFVGYGISAPDKSYDDYAGIDVKDKIVLMLRYAPDGSSPQSAFQKFTALRNKARVARDKGAAGMIMITGPADDPDDSLIKLATDQGAGSSGLPAVNMKRAAIDQLLTGSGWTVESLQDTIRKSRVPHSFEIAGATVKLETEITRIKAHTANVAAYLPGNDPALKDEVIILGAHFDHLGFGGPGSGSLTPDTIAIHNGADDNASGTAALLELAQAFAAKPRENKRTLLFLFFSGEELGTLGSGYYVGKPFFPLAQTVAMLNMDMVGRLQNRALTIGGSGTSSSWGPILSRENADSAFALTLNPDGFGPSDHSSFYGKDIPVLFFFTGIHDDYHKPVDDWDRINYAGEEKITKFVRRITHDVDTMAVRVPFTRVQVASSGRGNAGGDSRGFTVTLGIVPDVGESTGGMKISGVRPNGAAEKAGLKTGDIITSIGGKKVLNVYDYMGVLGELKAGQEVEVVILREGVTMKMTAIMQKRN
jgi:aminopeptidase YwaD